MWIVSDKLTSWLQSGRYLPAFMRDFHDQKDVFKAIHEIIRVEDHGYAKDISWGAGQCYVIDIFLWWMARRGYTLQRSRVDLPFVSLPDTIAAQNKARDEANMRALNAMFSQSDKA
jgi:hypothetical protein